MFRTCTTWGSMPRQGLHLAVTLLCAGLLTACGAGAKTDDFRGGFSSSDGIGGALAITTETVPSGKPGVTYSTTQLAATGARGPVTWTVAGGTLPPGLTLTNDGRVTGMPAQPGFYEFTAEASDGAQTDQQPLALAVDVFGVAVVDGTWCGDAWSGRRVSLRTAGAVGDVRFAVASDGSGGRFERTDPAAGTAVWVPGSVGALGATDRLAVTDTASGETLEIDLSVVADPTEGHIARFGTTDVWYLDWNAKFGRHPFDSDFHAALAHLGLRGVDSTTSMGSEADRLADLVLRVAVLRELNRMYLRDGDGSEGARGLAISFPLVRPGDGYVAAGAGGYMSRRANGFSVMSLCDQSGNLGAQGVAYQDDAAHGRQEHNAPGGELGVFVNYVAGTVGRAYRLYGDQLQASPVEGNDIPALKALLYGRAGPGGRYDLLRYQTDALARSIAFVAAHEIGHSCGAPHLFAYTTGAIMNTSALIGPGAEYFFTEQTLAILRRSLGTAGTAASAPQTAALSMPAGGIHVCGHCSKR